MTKDRWTNAANVSYAIITMKTDPAYNGQQKRKLCEARRTPTRRRNSPASGRPCRSPCRRPQPTPRPEKQARNKSSSALVACRWATHRQRKAHQGDTPTFEKMQQPKAADVWSEPKNTHLADPCSPQPTAKGTRTTLHLRHWPTLPSANKTMPCHSTLLERTRKSQDEGGARGWGKRTQGAKFDAAQEASTLEDGE